MTSAAVRPGAHSASGTSRLMVSAAAACRVVAREPGRRCRAAHATRAPASSNRDGPPRAGERDADAAAHGPAVVDGTAVRAARDLRRVARQEPARAQPRNHDAVAAPGHGRRSRRRLEALHEASLVRAEVAPECTGALTPTCTACRPRAQDAGAAGSVSWCESATNVRPSAALSTGGKATPARGTVPGDDKGRAPEGARP